ncbi:MAG: NYN domain-containing protein [Chloroflexi bacterium]|nr:NYN domain-containing protein [Chloroflexota bacterium]
MPYLIDGHNLIPKIPGLSLRSIDDEVQLIQRLQVFHQQTGKKIEVYFDNAPPGHSRTQRFGTVTAHFIRHGSTADAAIQARLDKLGRGASTWTVVSSDRQVQAAARAVHARVIKSEDFAAELAAQNIEQFSGIETSAEINISPDEVDEWLRLFGRDEG